MDKLYSMICFPKTACAHQRIHSASPFSLVIVILIVLNYTNTDLYIFLQANEYALNCKYLLFSMNACLANPVVNISINYLTRAYLVLLLVNELSLWTKLLIDVSLLFLSF